MDLWQMVLADHANIAELCREVLRATRSGPNGRESLFAELDDELERHLRAKENMLYPALMRDERTKAYLEELQRDHDDIRRMLDSLAATPDKSSLSWSMNFKELLSRVELYFTFEESGVLTVARGAIPQAQAEDLRRAYERERIAEIEARRWHMPVAMMPSRYGVSAGTVLGALAGVAAIGAAMLMWRSTQGGTYRESWRPMRRGTERPFPFRRRFEEGRYGRAGMRREETAGMPAAAMAGSDDDARGNWFSSANPPHAPTGLASDLQPGGVVPGGGPGAGVGSIGTGGGSTENRDTGSLTREGR